MHTVNVLKDSQTVTKMVDGLRIAAHIDNEASRYIFLGSILNFSCETG